MVKIMKKSDVRVGRRYLLSRGLRGQVAVTVVAETPDGFRCWGADFATVVSARRIQPCPITDAAGNVLHYAHEEADPCPYGKAFCGGDHPCDRCAD